MVGPGEAEPWAILPMVAHGSPMVAMVGQKLLHLHLILGRCSEFRKLLHLHLFMKSLAAFISERRVGSGPGRPGGETFRVNTPSVWPQAAAARSAYT